MLHYYSIHPKKLLVFPLLLVAGIAAQAQKVVVEKRVEPVWWFGESGAANYNSFVGTTQMLNKELSVPTAFHKGQSFKPYGSILAEYRPNKTFGGMLNVAFDNRGGSFEGVMAPCNCPATLSTNLSYVAIEPSFRIAPFSSAFYVFAGPTLGINLSKEFAYTQLKQTDVHADWSDVRKTVFGAQAGAGIDIPLSKKASATQMTLSPFASFQTDLFQSPRSVESWAIYTVRAGIALKFGTGKALPPTALKNIHDTIYITQPVAANANDVQFSVRAPKVVPVSRQVKEVFPLRNSVFFDMGATEIPARYVQLSQPQATAFKEQQLQEDQPSDLNSGRSARQLAVYYNILNIIGDRLRSNPSNTITLTGASDKNPVEGKLMAENVKQYLVTVFGIDPARITTEGRDKPVIPSEQPGGTKELDLLREGDRRVDVTSTSPDMLMQVGGSTSPFLKPVVINAKQADPLDSHVVFNTDGANKSLKYWSVNVTDSMGNVQYYGPFTTDQASVSGKTILGNNTNGNYKIAMIGVTKDGKTIQKENTVSLLKIDSANTNGLRYSILFEFDKSKTINAYKEFLTDVVAPLIPENGTVIIHGHTDIIGDEKYNQNLSYERAIGAQLILERAIAKAGTKGVKFETYGFGADAANAPFENKFPEERFYNRTVILDIVPNK